MFFDFIVEVTFSNRTCCVICCLFDKHGANVKIEMTFGVKISDKVSDMFSENRQIKKNICLNAI